MARYDHLPIWNDAMKLSVGIERAVMQFSRYHKYALGAELRRTAQAVLGGIVRAARASVFCRGKQGLLRYSEYPLTRHCVVKQSPRSTQDRHVAALFAMTSAMAAGHTRFARCNSARCQFYLQPIPPHKET